MDAEFSPEAAVRRIRLIAIALAGTGTLCALIWKGLPAGAGFALGAVASIGSFASLKAVTDAMGQPEKPRPRWVLAVLMGLRYLLLGVSGYVIVIYFGVDLLSALAGLLVSAAALLIEMVYELIHGT